MSLSFLTESKYNASNEEVGQVFDLLDSIEATSKSTEKQALYQAFENKDLVNLFLRPALDTSINFGIKQIPDESDIPDVDAPDSFVDLFVYTIDILIKKEIRTRKTLQQLCIQLLSSAKAIHPSGFKWISRILTKNIRMGFSEKMFTKSTGVKLRAFTLQLAEDSKNLTEHCEDLLENPTEYIVEPKLDGLRMVEVYENDNLTFISRNGKELYNTEEFANQISRFPNFDKYVFDGEIMDRDWNTSMSIVRSSKTKKFSENAKFNIFDIIPIDDFENQKCSLTLMERKKIMREVISQTKNITMVPWFELKSIDHLYELYNDFVRQGYEGAVIKRKDSLYEFKRSSAWLKLKPFVSGDYRCVGVFQGTGKYANTLGYIKVDVDGVITRVGGGFTDAQRDQFWAHQDEIVNHFVEVTYQDMTADGRLRFPRFSRVRYDKD